MSTPSSVSPTPRLGVALGSGSARGWAHIGVLQVMAEAGVDISEHQSKTLEALQGIEMDYVVTVCGHAHESCPVFPGTTQVIHAGFDDPPRLAAGASTEEEALAHYRRVRDEIRSFVDALPKSLRENGE